VNDWPREDEWAIRMRAAISGDGNAYRQFLLSVTPHLRSMVRSRCRAWGAVEAEAEDIVQEVLLAIHLKRGTWDPARPVGPWIAAIARNKLIDVLRRRGRHIDVPIDDVVDTLRIEERDETLTSHEVDGLLAQLKANQRDIVRSITIEGDSVRDTAKRLKMSEGAVRVALHRALQTLAALYRSKMA
jgi:RNA polymerase sigma-70 factor (ECF subfamily)